MAGLRPTPDRVRETLFNWLSPVLPGARCLDLFAGSGALGLEAASRGAAAVTLVEQDPAICRLLSETAAALGADRVTVRCADVLGFLAGDACAYDLVFIDPPYDAQLAWPALQALVVGGWLSEDPTIYLETARSDPLAPPPGWRIHREGHTQQVHYMLLRRAPPPQEEGRGLDEGPQ